MYDVENNDFSKKIKYYRKSRDMTLEELGNIISKTKATVSKYEKGEIIPDSKTILEICNALDISISQLFPKKRSNTTSEEYKNPFNKNTIYMYYYTENLLITSVIELIEEDTKIKVKYYNGVKDIKKYAKNTSYFYEGTLTCDKLIGYIDLLNISSQNELFEKVQIVFFIPWTKEFEMTNSFIMGLTPNVNPVVKKGIISTKPITDFDKYQEDMRITDEELKEIKNNNIWILNKKNYDHFYYK